MVLVNAEMKVCLSGRGNLPNSLLSNELAEILRNGVVKFD